MLLSDKETIKINRAFQLNNSSLLKKSCLIFIIVSFLEKQQYQYRIGVLVLMLVLVSNGIDISIGI